MNIFSRLARQISRVWDDYSDDVRTRRLYDKPRLWYAISPGARTPLGRVPFVEALKLARAVGPVAYTDVENAFIFVAVPGHSAQNAPDASGNS